MWRSSDFFLAFKRSRWIWAVSTLVRCLSDFANNKETWTIKTQDSEHFWRNLADILSSEMCKKARLLQISTILKRLLKNGREHRRRYSQERSFQNSSEGRSSSGKKEESTHSVGSGCPEHLEGESAGVRKPGPAEGHWRQSSQNNCSRDFRDNH